MPVTLAEDDAGVRDGGATGGWHRPASLAQPRCSPRVWIQDGQLAGVTLPADRALLLVGAQPVPVLGLAAMVIATVHHPQAPCSRTPRSDHQGTCRSRVG